MCKLIKLTAVLLGCTFLLASCASAAKSAAPSWVLNPSEEYPDADYLTAVGYAYDRATAENTAVAALTKILRQNVSAQTTAHEAMAETETGWVSNRNIASAVQTTTNLDITGIAIQDVWIKNGKLPEYYALAVLDRKEVGQIYRQRASSGIDVVNAKIQAAYSEKGSVSGYQLMKEAAVLAAETDATLDLLAVINPDYRRLLVPDYKNTSAVEELARQMLDAVKIYIEVEGDVSNRIASAFTDRVQEAGFKTQKSPQNATILLSAQVSFEPMTMSVNSDNKFVRFVLHADLVEAKTGKILESYETTGREAHLSESEAAQRAVRTIESYIKKLDVLADFE